VPPLRAPVVLPAAAGGGGDGVGSAGGGGRDNDGGGGVLAWQPPTGPVEAAPRLTSRRIDNCGGDDGVTVGCRGGGATAGRLVRWAARSTGGCSVVATVARRFASFGSSRGDGGGGGGGGAERRLRGTFLGGGHAVGCRLRSTCVGPPPVRASGARWGEEEAECWSTYKYPRGTLCSPIADIGHLCASSFREGKCQWTSAGLCAKWRRLCSSSSPARNADVVVSSVSVWKHP